ncbi:MULTISPECIES: ComF family protein [Clostridium]|uniref:Amidophosphoribosyltransferase n=1 Tax=Clostridium beijerinckii TaxID=1520 RepID=A0A1S9N5H3_CLOBE|nr:MULTISPECIES: ComF family protein [Clostridium]MBN7574705.1 ComF family protein [Clostridium beijerinckii]MBN7579971.1 ComF family protein [Clostridium beijerinckii]MBN7584470.1 ComF family protein [Clostridium beijerinckii]MBO0522366.1 ComF family protein [Clostridium beijerinckii]MZK53053.1 ComF family protein [Clostridium beijerinckii]
MGKAFNRIIKSILEGLIEVIYPRESYCIICKEDNCFGICEHCRKSIKTIADSYQDEIISYGYYGGVLKDLILKFKYKSNFTAGDILAEFLEEYIIRNLKYQEYVITYIPLSKKSKKIRGFNQCEYIAKKIAKDLSIEVLEILIKDKETKEQKRLKKDERYENIKDAFKIKKGLEIRKYNIILVDDVTTTGATLKEAYKLLRKYQVKDIKLLTLAKSHI